VSAKTAPLLGFWYPAIPSDTLSTGSMKALQMAGLPIVPIGECRSPTDGLTVSGWSARFTDGNST
jgi:hypothetical protein